MSQVNRGSLLPHIIVMLMVSASRTVPNLLKGVGRFAHIGSKTLISMTKNSAYTITINSTFIGIS